MRHQGKVLITTDGRFDLNEYRWDDDRFADLLVRRNALNSEQAMTISRFLREEIARMDQDTINSAIIEKLIGAKMNEYGVRSTSSVHLDKSIFVKNELVLTDNARTVLQRRYLRKDSDGRVIESPEDMFRRVAHHIARAEVKLQRRPRGREDGGVVLPDDDRILFSAEFAHFDECRKASGPIGGLFRVACR